MVKNRHIVPGMIGLAIALAACSQPATSSATAENSATASATASAPVSVSTTADDALFGTWNMTTLEAGAGGTLAAVPYSGHIEFGPETVSVQAMNPDTAAPDTAYTVQGYEAFYGDLTVNPAAGTWSVDVTSALARDLIGQTLTRNYEVTGDTLVLTPVDASEGWRVTYERVSD